MVQTARLALVSCNSVVENIKTETGNNDIRSLIGNLSEQSDIRQICADISAPVPHIDVLVHNAGALFNDRCWASNGTDRAVELMVTAPLLMNKLFLEKLGSGDQPGRVLTVSSGSMHTETLDVRRLQMSSHEYRGAKQYARAKRAQVCINAMWAQRISKDDCVFHALHPRWVATPEVTQALPGFSKVLSLFGLLRTPLNGANTMVWLTVGTGMQWYVVS